MGRFRFCHCDRASTGVWISASTFASPLTTIGDEDEGDEAEDDEEEDDDALGGIITFVRAVCT